jgi:hypothetical protein
MERYNDSNITPTQFLREVMHDVSANIADRITAAGHLLAIEPHGPPKPTLTIRIDVPQMLAELAKFPPELQRDLWHIKWCYDHGIVDPDLDHMEVQGNG